jgi:hypothetical protein
MTFADTSGQATVKSVSAFLPLLNPQKPLEALTGIAKRQNFAFGPQTSRSPDSKDSNHPSA